MKKIGILILMTIALASCKQNKIAYVDIQEIMKEYKGTKDTEADFKLKSDSISKQLDSLKRGWQQKVQQYQNTAQKMSAKSRSEKEKALMQEQQMIGQHQQALQQKMQAEGDERVKKLTSEIDDFIQKYAKGKGYNLVLGTSNDTKTVLYAEKNADITEDVLLQLNKSYKSK